MQRRVSSKSKKPKKEVKEANLLTASLAPSTIVKYERHVGLFYDWLHVHGHQPSTTIELDLLLSSYLQQLYDSGNGKAAAASTVYGLNLSQPGITKQLPYSLKSLQETQTIETASTITMAGHMCHCSSYVASWLLA